MNKIDARNVKLSKEEQMWEDLLASGKLKTVPNFEKKKKELMRAAKRTRLMRERSKLISIRVPQTDLEKLRKRAGKEGFKYQSVINSLIHKYATKQL